MKNIGPKVNDIVLNAIPFSVSRWNIVAQSIGFGMEWRLEDLPLLHDLERSIMENVTHTYWNAASRLNVI